jgi:hypothetical protein
MTTFYSVRVARIRPTSRSGRVGRDTVDLGLIELLEDDVESARRTFMEVLTVAGRIGAGPSIAFGLLGLGFCAGMTNERNRAVTLHGAADKLFEFMGESLDPSLDGYRRREHRRLSTEIGDLAFDAAYHFGQGLTHDEAVDLALASS